MFQPLIRRVILRVRGPIRIFAIGILLLLVPVFASDLPGQQAHTLRIASYNIQDKPVSAAESLDIRAIMGEIGDYEINGQSRPIDLMGFQEGPQSTSAYGFLEDDFESQFGGSYSAIYATADPSGCRTGFVYNTGSLDLINSSSIDNQGFTHRPMLATFRPVGGESNDEFSVLTLHLKAGSTGSDFAQRESETIQIASLIASLPAGRPVILLGDFNMKGSDEDAWIPLVAAGAQESINAPVGVRIAKWNNSRAFYPFHSQETTGTLGGMDDRFDLILMTSEFHDNRGIEFNRGSLTTFGNNSTHTLNAGISTGSGAAAVQSSLIDTSDHLPVFAEFDWGVFRTTPVLSFSKSATTNYTVRSNGPVAGGSGSSNFQVEGSANGNFACFGIIDLNMAGLLPAGRIATRIEEIRLNLVQTNESFTSDGPVSVYVASPAATAVTINASIQFQSGNDRLDCVPASLSAGAILAATYPGVHHSTSGSDLPDGTLDEIVLNDDAIRTAILNAANSGGTFRLIVVADHPQAAATYAGNTNASHAGPAITALYDRNGSRPSPVLPHKRSKLESAK